jgi:beta-lactam-binding protein with PASTA domain
MRKTMALAAAAAAFGTAAVAAGPAAGKPADSSRVTATTASGHVDARRVRVPNEVGKNHQAAQDDLQAHGFFNLRERDCTGRGRLLLFDRNWRVVRQSPRAGSRVSVNRAITLCSVKYSD